MWPNVSSRAVPLLAVSALIGSLAAIGIARREHASAAAAPVASVDPGVQANEVEELRRTLRGVQARMSAMDATDGTGVTREGSSIPLASFQPTSDPTTESPESDRELQLPGTADSESAERERVAHIVAFLDNELAGQPVDAGWSAAAHQQVDRDLLSQDASETQLGQVRCQTTLCSIEARHANSNAEQIFVMGLGRLDAFRDGEAFFERKLGDDGSLATRIFVSRAGQRLPIPPPDL